MGIFQTNSFRKSLNRGSLLRRNFSETIFLDEENTQKKIDFLGELFSGKLFKHRLNDITKIFREKKTALVNTSADVVDSLTFNTKKYA